MNRRDFVRLVGWASGASLLSSCDLEREAEKLIPYLIPPDDGVIPGKAVYYNTTCTECPAGCGISARVVDRRVTKLEGIDTHPVNGGALCVRGQASISRVYHPNRLSRPLLRDPGGTLREASWDESYAAVADALKHDSPASTGRTHTLLSGRTTGSLSDLIDSFCAETGVERLPEFELFSYAALRDANRILFDRPEVPSYRIDEADWMLTIGADLFETFVSPVSHAAQFGRAVQRPDFNWFHVEPHISLTGVQAKKRFAISPGSEVHLLAYLLREASGANLAGEQRVAELVEILPDLPVRAVAEITGLAAEEIEEISRGLLSANNPLLVAGGVSTMQRSGLDAAVLAGLLQWSTGMIDRTVVFDASSSYRHVGSFGDLRTLSGRLARNEIGVLIVCGTDPLGVLRHRGSANPLVGFDTNIARAKARVGLGDFMTPTLEACDVVLPISHGFESWGDAFSKDDTHGLIQPAIRPVHDTHSVGDILIEVMRRYQGAASAVTYEEFVLGRLKALYGEGDTEKMLSNGYARRGVERGTVSLNRELVQTHLRNAVFTEPSARSVLVVAPSIRSFDGRGRDIALLDEIPDPLTTVSWGGWVSVSKATADEKRLHDQDEVAVSVSGWSAELPVKVQPGLPHGVITVLHSPAVAIPLAIDERSGELIAVFENVTIQKTGKTTALPVLSGSLSQQGRGVIPGDGHGEEHRHEKREGRDDQPTFYPKHEHKDYRWAMAIDLDLCIGCAACVAACYVENNVPVVGPKLHLQGREMSWIRIEPFYDEKGEVEFQPMLCQHCDNAPCETVCPVYATYHNPEGLNTQVYNRCVGTRYCSNNCPYKVRRFNWFDSKRPSGMNTTQNPELSVRGRGIMEKCTFCVQRIRAARHKAKDENRRIEEREAIPACAQTCPTKAIVFGNLLDADSEVSRHARSDRAYRVLDRLGTRPAVYYLRSKWKKDDE